MRLLRLIGAPTCWTRVLIILIVIIGNYDGVSETFRLVHHPLGNAFTGSGAWLQRAVLNFTDKAQIISAAVAAKVQRGGAVTARAAILTHGVKPTAVRIHTPVELPSPTDEAMDA
ncbi:MAG: hypothetical protein BWY76_02457 [bacterium ADurb.Bin429]|nr:MAG: hypothetical protein BWY76_02457 [bacterium ADurb.Bin429]